MKYKLLLTSIFSAIAMAGWIIFIYFMCQPKDSISGFSEVIISMSLFALFLSLTLIIPTLGVFIMGIIVINDKDERSHSKWTKITGIVSMFGGLMFIGVAISTFATYKEFKINNANKQVQI